jgi:hypothetical protein
LTQGLEELVDAARIPMPELLVLTARSETPKGQMPETTEAAVGHVTSFVSSDCTCFCIELHHL